MTFGTETIPQVYKILGPGNQYVTAAKQKATQYGVSIDMPAGPSELLVVADETAVPSYVAADLLSQAEHGTDSQVVLVSTSQDTIDKVKDEVQKQLKALPRKEIAAQALANSTAIYFSAESDAMAFINEYGPEHYIICMANEDKFVEGWPTLDRCLLGIILLKVRVITLRGPITPYRPMGTPNNTVESTWIVFSRQLAFKK